MVRIRGIVCFLSMFILATMLLTEAADAKDVAINNVLVESGLDKELSILKNPVVISKGRVLLPIREVGDLLNLNVYWDQRSKTVFLYGVNKEIKLTIGSEKAYVNNKETSLDVVAKVINGKTYIPLKFVATATGESVSWTSSLERLTMSRSYALGSDKELTYWIHLDSGELSKAEIRETGVRIGQIKNPDLSILKNFDVSKISDSSSYIVYNQISGPSGTVKVSGQVLIVNDHIVDQDDFLVMGYYHVTNIQKVRDQILLTDGKNARFLDTKGNIQSAFNLTEIMGKDELYMIEEYNNDFMILREYSSQHLIFYDIKAKEPTYVHEAIDLPAFEKNYLIQAGMDRNNEMEYDHIILFDKVDSIGRLLFKYKSKKTNKVNTYKLIL
ncbi:copper amine oxidase N-terminal domain-containing protein [Paenibacillus sp. EC2-1]|uniref:copper amine oxidase N-terminal domain-containing protein n=1 Tax=Paenibacillus sp. EC2-1 TaxID=3388665 RepID=UPI003BEEE131